MPKFDEILCSGHAVTRSVTVAVAQELGSERQELEPLLAEADFVIVTCALTPQTQGMFSAERFALMKPTAIFINTSRGGDSMF